MTVTVNYVDGDVTKIEFWPAGSYFSTLAGKGPTLVGTTVTAYFDDDTSETATFVDSGGDRGDAIGTGWRVYLDGNDGPIYYYLIEPDHPEYWPLGGQPWHFVFEGREAGLTKLVIDVRPSELICVFDTANDSVGLNGTPGSAGGADWTPYEGVSVDVTVTYTHRVDYTDGTPYYDLWRLQTVEFASALTADFTWFQDHDLLANPPSVVGGRRYTIINVNMRRR